MASQRMSTVSEYLCTILGLDHAQRFNHQLIQKNKITWPTLLVRHTVIFVFNYHLWSQPDVRVLFIQEDLFLSTFTNLC